jgi:hypothetical protein
MRTRPLVLLAALILWPALSFAQSIFIDSPREGQTVIGPTVSLRMSVEDFELGQDGRIVILLDDMFVQETDRLRLILAVPPGTHQIEARLVNMRSKPIDTSLPETVKFTMDNFY